MAADLQVNTENKENISKNRKRRKKKKGSQQQAKACINHNSQADSTGEQSRGTSQNSSSNSSGGPPQTKLSRREEQLFRSLYFFNTKKQAGAKSQQKQTKASRRKMETLYPNLVPTKSPGHNVTKKLLSQVYVKENNYTIHHVWLDCLWNSDVTPEEVARELQPLSAGQSKSLGIRPENIFVVGYPLNSDVIQPTGSCFVLINKEVSHKRAKLFMSNVAANRIKIIQVNIAMLREQIRNLDTLIFSGAHKQLLGIFQRKVIFKACGLELPSQAQTQQPDSKPQPKVSRLDKPPVELDFSNLSSSTPINPVEPVKMNDCTFDTNPAVKKSKRIAASLNGTVAVPMVKQEPQNDPPKPKVKQEPTDYKAFEAMLISKVEAQNDKSDFVGQLYPDLVKYGNLVISVEPLPTQMTLYAFNLMMGTWSVKSEQILAVDIKDRPCKPYMTLRIVMKSTDVDAQRILSKNKFKLPSGSVLQIQKSNFKELEKFLMKYHTKIRRLDLDNILPTTFRETVNGKLNFNNIPKWAAGYTLPDQRENVSKCQ